MLGYHVSLNTKNIKGLDMVFKFFDCAQVFLGSPKTYNISELQPYSVPKDKVLIAHSCFLVNLVKDDADRYTRTLAHLSRLSTECTKIGAQYIVTHVGSIKEEQTKPVQEVLYNICMDWLEATNNHNTILCLECEAGSKKGTKKGHLTLLYNFVKRLNHPRIRICFDCEHAYANGFDLNPKQIDFLLESNTVSVIHLNSIPQQVELGSHLDRHTDCPITEGKEQDKIKYIYNKAKSLGIPCILERDADIVPRDIAFLEEDII